MFEQLTIEFIAFSLVGIIGVGALMFWGVIKRALTTRLSSKESSATDHSPPNACMPSLSSINSAISSTNKEMIEDESFYELAMSECTGESDQRHLATWSKAYSIADGDENKAKAIYIKLRVEKLTQEENHRRYLEKSKREQEEYEKKQKDYQEWIKESQNSKADSPIARKAKNKSSRDMWFYLCIASAIISFVLMQYENDFAVLTAIALLILSAYFLKNVFRHW